jgi:hypothetical protein
MRACVEMRFLLMPRPQVTRETRIPPVLQRLYLRGVELEDPSRTVTECGILPGDVVEVWQDPNSEFEVTQRSGAGQSRNDEGFGGTILSGGTTTATATATTMQAGEPSAPAVTVIGSSPDPMDVVSPENPTTNGTTAAAAPNVVECPGCTYHNHPDLERCELCNTPLTTRSTSVEL